MYGDALYSFFGLTKLLLTPPPISRNHFKKNNIIYFYFEKKDIGKGSIRSPDRPCPLILTSRWLTDVTES